MALGIIWLVQEYERTQDWVRSPGAVNTDREVPYKLRGDFGSLSRWYLTEPRPNADPSKKDSGFYKPTPHGIKFVNGEVEIARGVYTYNDIGFRFTDETLDIREALGKKYDYDELMKGNWG
jgi:hypothetical protein